MAATTAAEKTRELIGEGTLSTQGEIIAFQAKLDAAFERLDGEQRAAATETDDAGNVIYVDFGWLGNDAA